MRPCEREAATAPQRVVKMPKVPQPETRVLTCPRRPVASFKPGYIPWQIMEPMEHDQKLSSCCRHPENHDIEAWKSNPNVKGPDQYIFTCACGKRHTNWILGIKYDYPLPEWK